MKLKLKTNIGTEDIKKYAISAEPRADGEPPAQEGDVVDVADKKNAEEIVRRGWAVPAADAKAEPPKPAK